mmetsp:Transcript_370/g.507  ORF Transcript_370/g.507 Transcript_370/m.507 type:complete len:145 (+) Transcript_370:187-621(+)|eukprot:CAMPEP_0184552232 /NCGR_PEP_ID=MMETSP0199_2-20130426/28256_1 /TAXON_ID=1112570 /ORGANISM="Thraustochytrium sp., Strain LLF1b" /LENGTH=144 /DNA_ID=CAMNT_0026947663 /DNA_START=138 /DNA_END=572 /DNA_ORIENTATION=+
MSSGAVSMASSALVRGYRRGGPIQNAAKQGIFCGKEIGFGNNVSHSKRRTRRSWKPNTHWKKYTSETLDSKVKVKVTAHAIRCIRKEGSFDEFLLRQPRLIRDSETGQALRAKIIQLREERERAAILHHLGITLDENEGPSKST